MNPHKAYRWLLMRSKEIAYLESTELVLAWDLRTQIPPQGHAHRAAQLAALASIQHRLRADPKIGEMLAIIEGSELTDDPLSTEAANIREWRHGFDRAAGVPNRLVTALSRASSEGESAWQQAKPKGDWESFQPYLERIVQLSREKAEAIGPQGEPYDALLEDYEPGATTRDLEEEFQLLRESLPNLLNRIEGSRKRPNVSVLRRHFPVAKQETIVREVIRKLGYDFNGGRLDTSAHPFSAGIGPGDVRITTRFDESFISKALFSSIHEVGHALYQQGLPAEHFGTPRGRPASYAMNESQSLLWENLVARSGGFWYYFYPEVQERFPPLREVPREWFHFAINEVRPTLIRVDADEVTYILHVILRFELELALIRGELQVSELPGAWNEKMKKYLGITPPDHSSGVMQDIHWAAGAIGYFPCYALGSIYAAQLFDRANEELDGLDGQFSMGQFKPLLEWLKERIHSQGCRYRARDLVRTVTGNDPDPAFLMRYFDRKFGALYDV